MCIRDSQEAMDAVLNAAARRERTISFQFSPDLDLDIAVARLLTEEPYKYAYYVHCANAYFGEDVYKRQRWRRAPLWWIPS